MPHKSRSNRKANQRRVEYIRNRRRKPTIEEQKERAIETKEAKINRYPEPPRYRYSYDEAPPIQPECYLPRWW